MNSDEKAILVVKVGTSTLLGSHELPSEVFSKVADSVRRLSSMYRVVLVSSGATGFGMRHVGLEKRPQETRQLQALSMLGQVGLMDRWQRAFDGTPIGQVLLTRRELEELRPVESLVASLAALWDYGAVPVINENDAIASEEFGFSDNDQLAAQIAVKLGAKKLVLLTDQDGVQEDFGTQSQRRIEVLRIDDAEQYVDESASQHGRGGIRSKIDAARLALEASIGVYIANAEQADAVQHTLDGVAGTNVVP